MRTQLNAKYMAALDLLLAPVNSWWPPSGPSETAALHLFFRALVPQLGPACQERVGV